MLISLIRIINMVMKFINDTSLRSTRTTNPKLFSKMGIRELSHGKLNYLYFVLIMCTKARFTSKYFLSFWLFLYDVIAVPSEWINIYFRRRHGENVLPLLNVKLVVWSHIKTSLEGVPLCNWWWVHRWKIWRTRLGTDCHKENLLMWLPGADSDLRAYNESINWHE